MSQRTSQTDPLIVNFVIVKAPGRLGMTFAPGKWQEGALSGRWARDLDVDLDRLSMVYGAELVVSVMEEEELRLLRGPDDLEDVIAEVPPDEGTLVIFKNQPNAWHGFHSFEGPRRVIQLNWVTDMGVVKREQTRHRISAFFKRLTGKPVQPAM